MCNIQLLVLTTIHSPKSASINGHYVHSFTFEFETWMKNGDGLKLLNSSSTVMFFQGILIEISTK